MSLPLPELTFYRMPDVTFTGSNIQQLLLNLSSSLTSLVDYRGTTIPSTHLWTWATGSTSGSISVIYNTAVPSGASMTQNPTILFAGFTGSATPKTGTLDTYASQSLYVGLNINGTTYTDWVNTSPMTTGNFIGYSRIGPSTVSIGTTVIRNYVSQETVVTLLRTNVSTKYLSLVGAIYEPHTSYADSAGGTRTAEPDDRIYGLTTTGTTALTNTVLSAVNTGVLFSRSNAFLPTTSTTMLVTKASVHLQNARFYIQDLTGKYIFDKNRVMRAALGAYSGGNAAIGHYREFYPATGLMTNNMTNVIRDEDIDKFHIITQDESANNVYATFALKAAP